MLYPDIKQPIIYYYGKRSKLFTWDISTNHQTQMNDAISNSKPELRKSLIINIIIINVVVNYRMKRMDYTILVNKLSVTWL